MNSLVIPSPAKINLFLKVVGQRPDGYHEIVSLVSRIGLFDTVVIAFDQPSIGIECPHPGVPEGPENLAYRAAASFFEALSTDGGVTIFIDKVIPVAAGLGGGSSNAAAVLSGLNNHYGFPLAREKLMELALAIGADVPFFLFRHAAVARGIGEDLEPYEDLPECSVLLVCPRLKVSTAWVYKNFKLRLTNLEKQFKIRRLKTHFSRAEHFLFNDLEHVTAGRFPEISVIKNGLLDLGAEVALMSGSGPSVFGLFKDKLEAKEAVNNIKEQGDWETFLVPLLLP